VRKSKRKRNKKSKRKIIEEREKEQENSKERIYNRCQKTLQPLPTTTGGCLSQINEARDRTQKKYTRRMAL